MQAEYALTRRAVTLIVELERREVMFAQAGEVADEALAIYQTTVNTLRRTLETLGLQRRAKDIGPTLSDLLRADLEQQRQEQQRREQLP
jgi:ABC-type phosphate transport system auxiliary subunit